MSLRPTEIQIILSATRDIERIQHMAQQHSRTQQEQAAVKFQQEMEHRKKQAEAVAKTEESQIQNVEKNPEEKQRSSSRKRRQPDAAADEKQDKRPTDENGPHIIDVLA